MRDIGTTKASGKKRMVVLLFLTAAIIGGLLAVGQWQKNGVPVVKTVALTRQAVERTAVCAGTVQATDSVEVYTTVPCVAGEVAVTVGDTVSAGDVLVNVDKSATLAVAVSAGLSEGQAAMASSALPVELTAPSGGVVSAVNVKKGDALDTSTPCAVITTGNGIEIAVTVRENMLPQLKIGQAVRVSGTGFTKEYTGTLTEISGSARTRLNGTSNETVVDAVVTLSAEQIDKELLIGLNTKAEIVVEQRDGVLLVPYNCLDQTEDGQEYVCCWRDGTAVRCFVETGEEFSGGVEILSGVEEGCEVIVSPQDLTDGMSVSREAAS